MNLSEAFNCTWRDISLLFLMYLFISGGAGSLLLRGLLSSCVAQVSLCGGFSLLSTGLQ